MARIIEVAYLIHNEPREWTRPRLAQHFQVNKATIQRDIHLLCEMGIEIVPHRKQGYEMVSDFFLPALNLDLEEALALVTAASFYKAIEGKQAIQVLNRAVGKITSNLPKQTNDILNQISPQIEVPHQQVIEIDETHPYKEQLYETSFSRRKVFTMMMRYGHPLLCRAKSNAVFYHLPKVSQQGRGHPKKYGDRVDIRRLKYKEMEIEGKVHSVTSKVVRTKMCDAPIRLVVRRTCAKASQPYRYFCVFTTDLTLEISQMIDYYRQRWQIETAFRDAKQHFGFDIYPVKSRQSINGKVQLSFVAASVTKLVFASTSSDANGVSVETVCTRLGGFIGINRLNLHRGCGWRTYGWN